VGRGQAEAVARRVLKPAVWIGGLLPLALLLFAAATDALERDPVKDITHRTGKATLVLLFATLAVTPLRRATRWNGVIAARRPLGLFAFFYAVLHFFIYLGDQAFAPSYIVEDVVKHPYVTAGFTAFCLLVPLALTSTKASIRRLGSRWVTLHRLIYAAAILGVIHFYWGVKKDVREPLIYAAVLVVLLAIRIPAWIEQRRKVNRVRTSPLYVHGDATAA
jgi:methionine sulfoxide reductase heme-binding subunit